MFFHPRDWSDSLFDTEHENDSEGVLLTVQRDGSQYGVLKSAITVAHEDFYSYLAPGGNWSAGNESVEGTLQMASYNGAMHLVTEQEANQLWRPEQVIGTTHKLVNKQSGRVLEIDGYQSTTNGANIQTWTYDGAGDMKWQIVRH